MKTSIKKLLSNIQFNIIILLFMGVAIGTVLFSATATFDRINNLQEQDRLVKKLLTLDKEDLRFSQIESNGILKQLPITIKIFNTNTAYEFVNDIFIHGDRERTKLVEKLKIRYEALAKSVKTNFGTRKNTLAKRADMQRNVNEYLLSLYPLLQGQSRTLYQYFFLISAGLALLLLWILITLLSGKMAGKIILSDISALGSIEGARNNYKFKTTELNTLALKLRQQAGNPITPSKQDPVTQLLNYDGLKQMYDQRFTNVKSANIFICVLSIDNFTKLLNHYPESVIDPVLLKIASIMKLHKQQNDIVARIDEEHFAAVFVRSSRQKAFDDCDHIRQMVEDNRFKLPHTTIPITLSGGFATKSSSQSLDDAVKNAFEYLKIAQEKGGNNIAEIKDNTKIL